MGAHSAHTSARTELSSLTQTWAPAPTAHLFHLPLTQPPPPPPPPLPPLLLPLPLLLPPPPPLTLPLPLPLLQAKGGQVDLILHDDRSLLALQGPEAVAVLQVRLGASTGRSWGHQGARGGTWVPGGRCLPHGKNGIAGSGRQGSRRGRWQE